jgi:hypothetical protein
VIYSLIKFILKNKKIHQWLKSTYDKYNVEAAAKKLNVDIPEVTPIRVRKSIINECRLNIVLPALSSRHVFGGIATALQFFHELLPKGMDARIILSDEGGFIVTNNMSYVDWRICRLEDDDCKGKTIVCAGDRYGKSLAIREKDIFIATAWWTAVIVKKLIADKKNLYDLDKTNEKYLYLIQDFEPGFYNWSSRYALAESTYHDMENAIPVFNTSVLQDYFSSNNYDVSSSFVFQPTLNELLKPHLLGSSNQRERKILVYGRPSVGRNAFEILVESLKVAVSKYDFKGWTFYSAGEFHENINLGDGLQLQALGKLNMSEYAQLLNSAYAGISLMVSPHPSYPPLEMAAFGVKVIVNNFANKKLESFSKNIYAVDSLSPESVSEKLITLICDYPNENRQDNLEISGRFEEFIKERDPFRHLIPKIREEIFFNK